MNYECIGNQICYYAGWKLLAFKLLFYKRKSDLMGFLNTVAYIDKKMTDKVELECIFSV